MATYDNTVLPIVPITWAVLLAMVLVSYLISKLADLCFDHYLINYTNYEHREMIKARFEGEMNQIFLFNKKNDDLNDFKNKHKISILPIVVNEIKREIRREKKEIPEPTTRATENQKTSIVVKTAKEKPYKVDFSRNVKIFEETKSPQNFNNEESNAIKSEKRTSISSKYSAIKAYSGSQVFHTRNSLNGSFSLVRNNSLNNKNSEQLNGFLKKEESREPKRILLSNPYNEKFIEKHKENKRKLIKEKLKIFSASKSIETDSSNTAVYEKLDDTMNGSVNLMNKSPIVEAISLSETSSSDVDNLNQSVNVAKKNENYGRNKRTLIKQSTVETTLSSEIY